VSRSQTLKRENSPTFFLLQLFCLALSLYLIIAGSAGTAQPSPHSLSTPTPPPSSSEAALLAQLPDLLAAKDLNALTLDNINFNAENTQALLWMAASDSQTGELLAREPEAVFAQWDSQTQQWKLIFQKDPNFAEALANSDFKDTELVDRLLNYLPESSPSTVTYGGYYLPWPAGQTKRLTWSIGHSSCSDSYCYYAFDFADGTKFLVTAAKAGYVYHFKDSCANGDSNCTNSITLQDRSTTPYTYNIYMHIAQGSVPAGIRRVGAYVVQGQPIAQADDTGYSTGDHLHFMVVEQSTLNSCPNYCWGKSVDITFRDVSINWDPVTRGGRPRLPSEASDYGGQGQTYYTSGNIFHPGSEIYYLGPIFK